MNIWLIVLCALIICTPIGFSTGALIYGAVIKHRATRPVEYYPPRGSSPIDVLIKYYGHRADTHALLNPMMLYWAERGFITIEEDCKRGLKLTKLKDIEPPANATRLTKSQKRNFDAETTLFNALFAHNKVFYTLAAQSSHNKTVSTFIKDCKKSANLSRSRIARKCSIVSYIATGLSMVLVTLICGLSDGGPQYLMMIFPIVGVIAFCSIPNDGETIALIKYPFFAVWGGAPAGIALSIYPRTISILIACALIASIITLTITAPRIDIRTPKSADIYGRICAFKTFLRDAEIDRLETLVKDDPNYFFDILPYCYVLKMTDTLKAKFDRISLDGPSWYLGDMRDTLMF